MHIDEATGIENTITLTLLDLTTSDTKLNRSKEIFDNHSVIDAYLIVNNKKQSIVSLFDPTRGAMKTAKVAAQLHLSSLMQERKAFSNKHIVQVDPSMQQAAKRGRVMRTPSVASLCSLRGSQGVLADASTAAVANESPKPAESSSSAAPI